MEDIFDKCENERDAIYFRNYLKAMIAWYDARLALKSIERDIQQNNEIGLPCEHLIPYLKIGEENAKVAKYEMNIALNEIM